jgi:hypothetical protein
MFFFSTGLFALSSSFSSHASNSSNIFDESIVSKTSFSSQDIFNCYKLIHIIISYKKGTHKKFLFTYLNYILYIYFSDIFSKTHINLSLDTYFLLISLGNASKKASHQAVE